MRKLSLLIIIGFSYFGYGCQKAEPPPSLYQHLVSAPVIELELKTELEPLLNHKNNPVKVNGKLSWKGQALDITVSPRGNSRKTLCDFPPLKLKFAPQDLKSLGLANYSSLKLVTHCIEEESYVLKEYLAYQLFDQLTENCFKTQLVQITYIDTKEKYVPMRRFGILLEHKREMAKRIGGELIKCKQKPIKQINGNQYRLLTVFQYMIGNTDWNLSKRHNIKMIQIPEGPTPIPYDFDFAGLVGAPYAQPHPSLPIESVQERLFQWRGKNKEEFTQTIQLFQSKKEQIIQYCENFDCLPVDHKKAVIEYLYTFYDLLDQVSGLSGERIVTIFKNDHLVI